MGCGWGCEVASTIPALRKHPTSTSWRWFHTLHCGSPDFPPTTHTHTSAMSTPLTSLFRPVIRTTRSFNGFSPSSSFHTSAPTLTFRRTNRDRNKLRGVSALRRSPKKIALATAKLELPKPVDLEKHNKVEVDPDHGLWGFFYDKKALPIPVHDTEHGMLMLMSCRLFFFFWGGGEVWRCGGEVFNSEAEITILY